jgi:hypothetical protein
VALVCASVSASVVVLALWPARPDVRTEDRDGDGRPDVWRVYDRQGQLVELAIDSNFDGRSDVREYYRWGALVRRESDRKFSGRVDYIEDFDAATHERVRSVADTDDDGTADLLVLFVAGKPVFTKRVSLTALVSDGRLHPRGDALALWGEDAPVALTDPFVGETVFRSALPPTNLREYGNLWMSVGLPAQYSLAISWTRPASDIADLDIAAAQGAPIGAPSLRGPPSLKLTLHSL